MTIIGTHTTELAPAPARQRDESLRWKLTDAEKRVARLMLSGHTAKITAHIMSTSVKNIFQHRQHIRGKLGVLTDAEAINVLREVMK